MSRGVLLRTSLRIVAACWLAAATSLAAPPGEREAKVRGDKAALEGDEHWVYNDFEKAVAAAQTSGKPLLVVLRCIPCEACSEFDDQVVRRDPAIRALMDRFVCVRIVQANGLDLEKFQYDFDQSFHAFLMHADGTIYGRFGTRSENRDESQDMTMQGFARALELALAWHRTYPENRAQFTGKVGRAPLVRRPEQFASLKDKYTSELNYQGNVVQSCIHCHQVREAERRHYRDAGLPMPEYVLFPHPLPQTVGLIMNPLEAAEIKSVAPGSAAASAGFQSGDQIAVLGGQPLLSIADLQFVLHQFGAKGTLMAEVRRGGETRELALRLEPGWRVRANLSWRPTSWDLRRMTTGGLVLEELPAEQRAASKLPDDALALRVKHVGQYNEHAAAKKAGFQRGDVLVSYDGSRARMSETQLLARGILDHRRGDRVSVTVLRAGQEVELKLPQQ